MLFTLRYSRPGIRVISLAKTVDDQVVLDITSSEARQCRVSKGNTPFQILGNGEPGAERLQSLATFKIMAARQYLERREHTVN